MASVCCCSVSCGVYFVYIIFLHLFHFNLFICYICIINGILAKKQTNHDDGSSHYFALQIIQHRVASVTCACYVSFFTLEFLAWNAIYRFVADVAQIPQCQRVDFTVTLIANSDRIRRSSKALKTSTVTLAPSSTQATSHVWRRTVCLHVYVRVQWSAWKSKNHRALDVPAPVIKFNENKCVPLLYVVSTPGYGNRPANSIGAIWALSSKRIICEMIFPRDWFSLEQ